VPGHAYFLAEDESHRASFLERHRPSLADDGGLLCLQDSVNAQAKDELFEHKAEHRN
jgi:hypothetical protein